MPAMKRSPAFTRAEVAARFSQIRGHPFSGRAQPAGRPRRAPSTPTATAVDALPDARPFVVEFAEGKAVRLASSLTDVHHVGQTRRPPPP